MSCAGTSKSSAFESGRDNNNSGQSGLAGGLGSMVERPGPQPVERAEMVGDATHGKRRLLAKEKRASFQPRLVSNAIPGLYRDGKDGAFYVRVYHRDGRRRWERLKAITVKFAVKESEEKLHAHKLYLAGESKNSPFCAGENTFKHLSQLYLDAGCPHSRTAVPRSTAFCSGERARIDWLNKYFGDLDPNEIKLPILMKHADWRIKQCRRGGNRVVEMEWVTLSNVLSFGVFHGIVDFNHVRQQRPQLRLREPGKSTAVRIRSSREVAPPSGDVVHQVAAELLSDERSQSTGFLWLFACLTGLRRSELLALRLDARPPLHPDGVGEPGYNDDRFLHVRRGKRSRLHKVLIYPELSDLLNAHFRWHQAHSPGNPWYFPGQLSGQPLDTCSASHRLAKLCVRLGLPHITLHGARSFFTTVLRSKGLGEAEIAARIGDSTVEVVAESYGSIPGNWQGGASLSFLPKNGVPAWNAWNAVFKPQDVFTPSNLPPVP